MSKRFPVLSMPGQQSVLTARYSQAMALASRGTSYIVVSKRNGDGGGEGAYQLPTTTTPPNVWRTYEFPTLQNRNDDVTSVKSVDASNSFAITEDWTRGGGGELLPFNDADDLQNPARRKRANTLAARDDTCTVGSSSPITVTPVPSQTPTPSLVPVVKQCHGVSGNTWVVSRDVAAQNAADFCQQTSNTVEYVFSQIECRIETLI